MSARPEDALFADHVLRKKYATRSQVAECLELLERLRGEMELDESLGNVLRKKGYLTEAQLHIIEQIIDPAKTQRQRNFIPGYQLLERIGVGAMGSVYRAHHLKLDIPVAIKVLRPALSKSKTQIERLKREAQLVARLAHPNIVVSRDVGEAEGFHYIVLELVDGETVRQRMRREPLSETEALRIVRDVARALGHAHAQGIVHRDVKPGNIMLTKTGVVKLADFGLARGKAPSDLTLEHASVGTPQYIAPEQMQRAGDATGRSDLFSLGASLFHMVTNRPPFDGENLAEIVQNVLACHFPPPETIAPHLSVDTIYLIYKLMRPDPARRYGSAEELIADLDRIERGERIAPKGFKGDHEAFLRRRRIRLVTIGGFVIAAVVALGLVTTNMVRKHTAENARLERCLAADRFGAARMKEAQTVAQLRTLLAALAAERAGADECRTGELSALALRLRNLQNDLAAVRAANGYAERAAQAAANYRDLYRKARQPTATLHTRPALDEVLRAVKRIREESVTAVKQRNVEVYDRDHASAAAALKALEAFAHDLRTRYLKEAALGKVETDAAAYAKVVDQWDAIQDLLGTPYIAAKQGGDFEAAGRMLDDFLARRTKMLRGLNLPYKLTRFFKDDFDSEKDLVKAEQEAFRTLKKAVAEALAKGDVAGARKRAGRFRPKETEAEYTSLLSRIRAQSSKRTQLEDRELEEIFVKVGNLVAKRRWGQAADAIDVIGIKDRVVEKQAWENVRSALRALEQRAKKRDLPFAELLKSFDFHSSNPGDPKLRRCFLVAESYAAADYRQGLAHLDAAGDVDWPRLASYRAALVQRQKKREDLARKTFDKMEDMMKGQQGLALDRCEELLGEPLRYTDFVDGKRTLLEETRKTLSLQAGGAKPGLSAGLPAGQYVVDADSGRARIRWDFRRWYPDEDRVPLGTPDPRAWAAAAARSFWHARWKAPMGEFETFYHRATHQLLWFNDVLVPHAEEGAVMAGEAHANYDLWWAGQPPRVVTLHNPLDLAKPWRLELVADWEAYDQGENKDGHPDEPLYFALAAGDVSACVLHASFAPGGGKGVRILRQKDMVADLEKLFADFSDRRKRKRLKGRDKAYFPVGFRMQRGTRYRLRLEFDGKEVAFRVWQNQRPVPRNPLVRLALKRAPRGDFRLLSLVRCRLHEVVMEGYPAK